MKEIINLRKPKEKHFLKKDGTIDLFLYKNNIHYLENDKYQEIDNTIIENKEEYYNKANSFKVHFFKQNQEKLLKVQNEKYKLTINIEKHQKNITVYKNTIKYKNLLKGIDIEYILDSTNLKDFIKIHSKENELDKLVYRIQSDVKLELLNNVIYLKKDNSILARMETPSIKDKNNVFYPIYYDLEQENNVYLLRFDFDKQLLEQEELYPFTIDPVIIDDEDDNVYDTYIYPGDTNAVRNNQDLIKVGVDSNNIVYRSLLKFSLPTIGTGCDIVSSWVTLTSHSSCHNITEYPIQEGTISVHEITESWDESTANWEMMNDKFNPKVEDYFKASRSYSDIISNQMNLRNSSFNITNLVKRWYSGKDNNGIMLKFFQESYDETCPEFAFYSKNNTITEINNPKPYLMITYRNQNGLESYMTYQSINLKTGTSYINNLTGNVTNIFELNRTISGKLPITASLIYNTNDVIIENDFGYGLGYKLNLHQELEEYEVGETKYLKYLDEDGSVHYFILAEANEYIDEDGLNLTITKETNTCLMIDKNGNQMNFSLVGTKYYLTNITDVSNNQIIITYDGQNRISKIVDGNQEEINFSYETDKIVCTSNYETTTINKKNYLITSIATKMGTTFLNYNEQNLVTKIQDINGKYTKYDYYNTIPYRVYKITELGINEDEGTSLEFEYGFLVTKVKDNKGRIHAYSFNEQGNTIGLTNLDNTNDFKNSYGIFKKYDDFNYTTKNRLLLEANSTKYTNNLMNDSSFEIQTGYLYDNAYIDESNARTGNKCLCIIAETNIELPIVSETGLYTFSGYFKHSHAMEISLKDDINEVTKTSHYYANDEYTRYILTANFEANKRYYLNIFPVDNATIYLDDVQLEQGEIANLKNIIENSSFENTMDYWTNTAQDSQGNTILNDDEIVTLEKNEKAYQLKSYPNQSKTLSQLITVNGKKNDTYKLSFWYKNEGIKNDVMTTGNLVVLQFYYNEDISHGTPIYSLNSYANEWQYFQMTFVAEEDYSKIQLNIISQNNANSLYVTNFNLTKDFGLNTYQYDDSGNLISAIDNYNQTESFKYDSNNQLIARFTPKGNNFRFEYDNTDTSLLKKGISSSGLTNSIEYDVFKNPIKTKLSKKSKFTDLLSKSHFIRLKGTNQYLDSNISEQTISIKEPSCSIDTWVFEKNEQYYYLKSAVMPLYMTVSNDKVFITKLKTTLFEVITNDNGSYTFLLKGTSKALTNENNNLVISTHDYENNNQQFYLEDSKSNLVIETIAEYTSDGKFIKKITDALEKETIYDIDPITGLTKKQIDPKGYEATYTYNDKEQVTSINKNDKIVNYQYNSHNQLSKIITDNKEYSFIYDNYLNSKQIKINDTVLVTNNYEEKNGNLLSIDYGNNSSISYTYDELDRLKSITKGNKVYTYSYNNLNELAKVESTNEAYFYYYDEANRISHYEFYDKTLSQTFGNLNDSISYTYDINNNVLSKIVGHNTTKYETNYSYDEDDNVVSVIFNDNILNYTYDELGRLNKKEINNNLPVEFTYYGNGNKTSFIVKTMKVNSDVYKYIYDDVYNITHIYKNDILAQKYTYDEFNELIREDNHLIQKTYHYQYDQEGNILSKRECELNTDNLIHMYTYEYNNTNWKDQLTKYNDISITYDAIGNPLTIGSKVFSWSNGRELQSITDNDLNISYEYNKDGIRNKKIVNGVVTKYFTENSHILFEETNNNMIYYIRDDNNELLGLRYNGEIYYYQKNLQNDIIGIYNSSYELVAKYEYDAWGKLFSIKNNLGEDVSNDSNHIANINPYRYRSYYYDNETNLYYLNNRYYNPEWGRFINADSIIGTSGAKTGYNLYVYCNNNSVNNVDDEGNFAITATAVVAGTAALGALAVIGTGLLAKASKPLLKKAVRVVVNSKVETSTKVKDLIQPVQEDNNWNVYVLVDNAQNGKVEYVGRTVDLKRREADHKRNEYKRHLTLQPVEKNISYYRARGVEQALIMKYSTLQGTGKNYRGPNNKVNGIGYNNRFRFDYIAAAVNYFGEETYVGDIKW